MRQGRLLIVDDEPDMLENVCRILGKAGYDCLTAGEPRKALALLESERPDVLLTDLKIDRKSTRLNSSHIQKSRMPSSA